MSEKRREFFEKMTKEELIDLILNKEKMIDMLTEDLYNESNDGEKCES